MSKVKQTNIGSDIYRRIQEIQMSEADRAAAARAMSDAEAIVDLLIWAKNKVAAIGTFFLKPSLKH
jgi:hypothetical protein